MLCSFICPFAATADAKQLITDEELVLRMGNVSADKFPFILAYDQGLFEKNGIKLTPKFSPGSVRTINRSGIEVAPENIYDPEGDDPYTIAVSGTECITLKREACFTPSC
jgi:hypothetical protein